MKLSNLIEANMFTPVPIASLRLYGQKHLIVEVDYEFMTLVYVITDVPKISTEQYSQLYRTSFESGSISTNIEISPVHLSKTMDEDHWYDWLEAGNAGPAKIEKMKWKEFVAHMKSTFPLDDYDEDDFRDD